MQRTRAIGGAIVAPAAKTLTATKIASKRNKEKYNQAKLLKKDRDDRPYQHNATRAAFFG
jgi:hypothetical protein